MTFAKLLPMAFVMIAGPQILSAIFLATTENWRRNSVAYVAGAALSITLIVTIAYFVGSGASDSGASDDTLYIVVLVLLVAAAVHTFLTRKTAEPPKWMGKLQTADAEVLVQARVPASRGVPDRHPHVVGRRLLSGGQRRLVAGTYSPSWLLTLFFLALPGAPGCRRSVNGRRPSFRRCATG